MTIIIRINSHRARDRMESAIGRMPTGFYSWKFPGEFREVTAEEYAQVRDIPGITRARVDRTELREYINWGYQKGA